MSVENRKLFSTPVHLTLLLTGSRWNLVAVVGRKEEGT